MRWRLIKVHYQEQFLTGLNTLQVGQARSFLNFNTKHKHVGSIGNNRGETDYMFFRTGIFTSNLQRLIDEGAKQTKKESMQRRAKVIVFNSKIYFVQPMHTQLTVITTAVNNLPMLPAISTAVR